MNPDLSQLHPYPFEKLAELKRDWTAPDGIEPLALSIGEPQHNPPSLALEALTGNLAGLAKYPGTRGSDTLRNTLAGWINRRYSLGATGIDPDTQVLPVNGTREALFAIAQCLLDRTVPGAQVLVPNPFYQIYEGATLLAGLEPNFYPLSAQNGYRPDLDHLTREAWSRCQMIYLCNPGNPTGATLDIEQFTQLIELAHEHDFVIVSDECYSEIYPDESTPPPGLLEACKAVGNDAFERALVFNSLSKRSSLPGLRSGFVAGDANLIAQFLRYRTYHGSAMSLAVQSASVAAWSDEAHVLENRALYREKFRRFLNILDGAPGIKLPSPQAGFFLWPELELDDIEFTRCLFETHNMTVVPGRLLAREVDGDNPGKQHVRIALVADADHCERAAHRIRETLNTL